MIGLIFGIIFLIAGIVTGIILSTKSSSEYKYDESGYRLKDSKGNYIEEITHPYAKLSWVTYVSSIFLCILCIFFSSFVSVNTGHTGVVTTFGRVADYTLDAGFHFKTPWQNVI